MAKPRYPSSASSSAAEADFETPTLKRDVPAELHATTHITRKLRKAEIDELLTKEREESGMIAAVSDEDIAREAERESRESGDTSPVANDEGVDVDNERIDR